MLPFPSSDIGMFGRRQRHARGHRIPVTVVGRDSTMPEGRDTAVVVDDFGANDITPLRGGCACCTVRGELQIALRRLLAERAQRPFDRVIIETDQGIGPILRTFAAERALAAEFYVESDLSAAAFGTHDDGICHFALTENAPLPWDTFSRFMTTLTALRGADLLHAKGLLNIAGCRGPVAVQFVQHLALSPVELQACPDGDRASRVEFVTRNVTEKSVRNLFDSVRSLA